MKDTFIGVIQDRHDQRFWIGIGNMKKRRLDYCPFVPEPFPYETLQKGSELPDWLYEVNDFLKEHVEEPMNSQVMLEIPTWIYPSTDPRIQLTYFLNTWGGYCLSSFLDEQGSGIRIGPVPSEQRMMIEASIRKNFSAPLKHERLLGHDLKFLGANVSQAYMSHVLSRDASPAQAALGAALITAHPGLYSFLFSGGLVQSSQDIVYFMENRQDEHGVFSSGERYIKRSTPQTRYEGLDKIPLKYAVATKKYEHLGQRESIKLAFLEVAKAWKFSIYCSSRSEMLASDTEEYPVYLPEGIFEAWIVEQLQACN